MAAAVVTRDGHWISLRFSSARAVACNQAGVRYVVGHSVLVKVAGNGVRDLAVHVLAYDAGNHVVWPRPQSAEDYSLVSAYG